MKGMKLTMTFTTRQQQTGKTMRKDTLNGGHQLEPPPPRNTGLMGTSIQT